MADLILGKKGGVGYIASEVENNSGHMPTEERSLQIEGA